MTDPTPQIRRVKGCLLKFEVATVLTPVSQLISLKIPKPKSLDYEAKMIDQSAPGIRRVLTGEVDGGSFEADNYWDPLLGVMAALLAAVNTPTPGAFQVAFISPTGTTIDFNTAGMEFGVEADVGKGLTVHTAGNVDGLPAWTIGSDD